jgi:hypothetical protein
MHGEVEMSMRVRVNDTAVRALKEHVRQQLPTMAQQSSSKLQSVYDRVLATGQGRDVDEVRDLLAVEWRSTFGQELAEPNLTEAATMLADGRRIEVRLRIQG